MSILVVGINHRSGPLDLLERVTVAPDRLGKAVAGLAQRDSVREATIVSTCNRTEVYVVAEMFHGAYGDVRDLLCDLGGLDADTLSPHLYSHHDQAAITHLFEVAAGLDSAVLGESEILGQVRGAWEIAHNEGAARATLNQLFRAAIATGKRARSETGIGRGTASISHAAVEMISDTIGTLDGRRVLVIGAGAMGEGVAVAFHRAGGAEILVANRTIARGAALADRVGGIAVGFERLGEALAAADVVVVGTGADQMVLTEPLLAEARRNHGAARPLHVVDLGVPRNVDPDVTSVAGVTLWNLDDLRDWADRGLSHRAVEAERVRVIVGEEVERFLLDATARQAAPLVASMHDAAEQVRAAELERFASRIGTLDEQQRDAVDALTRAIVAKLLHEPSVRLKSQAGTPQGERNAAALRDLFDIG
jgi:glutamyl-tRNA reductase